MRFRQSYAKTLLEYCPAVLKKRIDSERKQTKAMAAGSLVDYVLFGRTDRFEVVDARYKTGARQGCPAEDWQCGEAREQADEIRSRGLLPVLECELDAAEAEAAPVRRRLDRMRDELNGDLLEQPHMTWTSELGVECEGTPDVVLLEHVQGTAWVTVIDIKRTDQRMSKLARQVHAMGWDVQAWAYREGVICSEMGMGHEAVYRGHIILSVDPAGETEPCARPLEPMYLEIGRRRWERAQTIWRQCLDTDSWPGYEEKPIAAPFYIERSETERREYYTFTEADEEP
jgi:hypothetical protein